MTVTMASSNAGLMHLSNALASAEQLSTSSSAIDGVASDLETSVRFAGAQLTQAAGILLRLSQDIIAQAIVTFTRFWIGPEGGSLRIYSVKVGSRSPDTLGRVAVLKPLSLCSTSLQQPYT